MPFEGYNFLPTSYGYRSYFGTTSRLDIPPVPARVPVHILSYQSDTFINNLIALCEDGIWVIDPTAKTNTWKHVIVHTYDSERSLKSGLTALLRTLSTCINRARALSTSQVIQMMFQMGLVSLSHLSLQVFLI